MNTKEKVLQKCAELRNPSAPWINEEWDLKRYVTTNRWELHRHKGLCDIRYQFSDDVPDDDVVWPIAAQVLGIGVEKSFMVVNQNPPLPKDEPFKPVGFGPWGVIYPDWLSPEHRKLFEAFVLGENNARKASTYRDEQFRAFVSGLESPKPDWVKEEIKEMMQPSRQLLWEAFLKGHNAAVPIRKEFNEWVQALPPDTLKEDRELVKRYLSHEFSMGNGYLTIQTESFTESVALANALKRLCGMEVGG